MGDCVNSIRGKESPRQAGSHGGVPRRAFIVGLMFNTRLHAQPFQGGFRYFIEKDFPCAHPRPAEAMEAPSECFAVPVGFAGRKA